MDICDLAEDGRRTSPLPGLESLAQGFIASADDHEAGHLLTAGTNDGITRTNNLCQTARTFTAAHE